MEHDGLCARHAVGGQLHHKRHGIAAEQRVFQQQAVQYAHDHAARVQRDEHQGRLVRKERRRERRIDGQLGRAGHEGREQYRHPAVTLAGERAGGHDGGHRAAEADQHRHERPARQPDLAQQLIHHERHARHVAAVLQYRQEEEQRHDRGQEGQHRAHAHAHAVDEQRVHRLVDADARKRFVEQPRHPVNAHRQKIRKRPADHIEGQVEHQQHHREEDGNAQIFVRQYIVDADGALHFLGVAVLPDRIFAGVRDECIAHVRQRRLAIRAEVMLHLGDDLLDDALFTVAEVELGQRNGVALHHLGGGVARGQAGLLQLFLDDVRDGVHRAVYLALAQIQSPRALLLVRHLDGALHELVAALVFCRRDGHDGQAEVLAQLLHIDGVAIGTHLVHHVQRNDHRHAHLHQLQRKVQVALDVGRVYDVDYRLGLVYEQKVARHHLLGRVG